MTNSNMEHCFKDKKPIIPKNYSLEETRIVDSHNTWLSGVYAEEIREANREASKLNQKSANLNKKMLILTIAVWLATLVSMTFTILAYFRQ